MDGILIECWKVLNRVRHGRTAAACGETPESAIMAKTATRWKHGFCKAVEQSYAMARGAMWRHE
ncbi:MAG: hypothetical protein EOP92_05250 [Lysobacteraceae bacterium]|nr:MAG: hypothetical protein EOP92_05250 [Xanthomonadaceae bacterium]